MSSDMDDEELTFDDPAPAETSAKSSAKVSAAEAPEQPKASEPEPAPKAEAAPAAEAAAPARKRSRTGMAVAAGFAVCILASVTSAVQAWRAANIAAESSENASSKALAARLNSIEKILEQQRDSIDGLSANPNAPVATADKGSDQLNALAAAVRANQEMNERLPSMIMQQVDNRLAKVSRPAAPPSAPKPYRKASSPQPKPKSVPKPVVASAKPSAPQPLPVQQVVEIKRPAGEAIRYP